MNLLNLLTGFGVFFGLGGGVAAGVVLLRSTAYQTTVSLLSSEVDAYKTKVDLLELSDAECKTKLEQLTNEYEHLKAILSTGPRDSEIKTYIDGRFDEMIGLLGGRG